MVWPYIIGIGVAALLARPTYNAFARALATTPSTRFKGGFSTPMTRNEAIMILGLR